MRFISMIVFAISLFVAHAVYAGTCGDISTVTVGTTGPGGEIIATDPDIPQKPDFIVKRIWLELPGVGETYEYMMGESIDTKAQSENIGEASCVPEEPDEITGHFYLSKGYKEDAHSEWRRLDSTTTQCSNLEPGDTNTETKNTVISEWITEPGIYNIVYCQDHPQDDHNNGGDHVEEHESNNCSTEAVFEVVGLQTTLTPIQPSGKSWSQLTVGERAALLQIILN